VRFFRAIYRWIDERLDLTHNVVPILAHPTPRSVNWWYVLGSATLVSFIFQVITGVALAFTYVPAPSAAYDSIMFITHDAGLGHVVRGIHFFGASAMMILIFAHMVRVFLLGSFKFPRELNWVTGVGLLALTFLMAFTGQLLRWNQDSYWATVLSASMISRIPVIGEVLVRQLIAGDVVGGPTLTRFFGAHVFLLPAGIFGLIAVHIYLLLWHGISEYPQAGLTVSRRTYRRYYHAILEKASVPFVPDIFWRDLLFALGVGAVVVTLAVLIGPPALGEPADPTNIVAYPRPDWYFMWYFALLALIPREGEDLVLVFFLPVVTIALLLLPFVAPTGERHPRRRPWAVAFVGISVISVALLIVAGFRAPWSPDFNPPPLPASVTAGLNVQQSRGATVFYQKGCIYCHQIAGVGGQRGPDLTNLPQQRNRDQTTLQIANGSFNMPGFRDNLPPDDLEALLAFLYRNAPP
jgi:ubiquinol-cytochrome c reductase cytochrome b subunit